MKTFCWVQVFLFLFGLFLSVPAVSQSVRPRYALVIGNSAYRHVDSLPNTVNDASGIAKKLSGLGYSVELLFDSDLAGMGRAVSAWIRQLSTNRASEGFFWYAGHGMQVSGENYLLPVDINAEDEAGIVYGSYPLGRILLALEQTARNKLNVVVLDACRDNPFKNLKGGSRGLSRGFVTVEHPPQDIFVMFSTSPGTTAADGDSGRNSPFAEAFLKYMDSDEILPVMAGLVTRETMRLTGGKQRPYQNGSIVSELYYSLSSSASAPAREPPAGSGAASLSAAPAGNPVAISSPVMAAIPAGSFTMGSPVIELDRDPFGETRHRVNMRAFYIASKELTVGEFRRFVEDTGHVTTAETDGGAQAYDEAKNEWFFRAGANWRNPGFRQGDDHPVVCVSWFDAVKYCNWLSVKEGFKPAYTITGQTVNWDRSANGYRLPTDAEWEYACRAGTSTPLFTGESISTSQANYNGSIAHNYGNIGLFRKATVSAGSFPPNAWGVYDMHGNVWEWCWDYYSNPNTTSLSDPTGPASGTHRINRGGSWSSPGKLLRSAVRASDFPETAGSNLGFRLARNK
ncbi:MAG: SUMF1/EgtB/PvdO family nonheme iron enzyme [Treponema sp.]|jgi:formylglycine-generating enzyme required for sulfatase activity|nr:SUMF1/EgtB/PvdO family nonheme iron enzyme [Treponema sp.]